MKKQKYHKPLFKKNKVRLQFFMKRGSDGYSEQPSALLVYYTPT